MRQAMLAEPAVVTGNMGFAGDPVPHFPFRHVFTHGNNVARSLVTGDDGCFYAVLAPVIPLHDVQICSADSGTVNFDQHLVVFRCWQRQVRMVDQVTRHRRLFYKAAHVFFHEAHLFLAIHQDHHILKFDSFCK